MASGPEILGDTPLNKQVVQDFLSLYSSGPTTCLLVDGAIEAWDMEGKLS